MRYGRGVVAPTLILVTLFILETIRARKLKFGMLVNICRYYGNVKICPLVGVWEISSAHVLFWDPSISP